MRAGLNMRHVTVHLMREDLPLASLALAELEQFVPDHRAKLQSAVPKVPGQRFRHSARQALTDLERLEGLLDSLGLAVEEAPAQCVLSLNREQMYEIQQWLGKAWAECAPMERGLEEAEDKLAELEHLQRTLDEFSELGLDPRQLQRDHGWLDLQIGTLPATNLLRLQEALAVEGHLIVRVVGEGDVLRLAIAGLQREGSSLHKILAAAGFQAIEIPPSFHDDPQRVRDGLHRKRQAILQRQVFLRGQLANWADTNQDRRTKARCLLALAEPYVELGGAARTQGALAVFQGWLPEEALAELERLLKQHLHLPYVIEQRRPGKDEQALVPIPPIENRWLQPFARLMQQYGVPRFGEIDPTWLFGITFAVMFGMMFGDVGHGLVFVAVGVVLRQKLGIYNRLFIIAGVMAMLFGFLYGSIFGVEHWLHPWWIAPMSDPIYMLTVALAWGVAFLTIGSLIAVINRLLVADIIGALFDPGGVFSLLLYYALLGGLISLANGHGFPLAAWLVLGFALVALVAYQWHHLDAPFGERFLTVLIETFEIVSGYVSNSLSFLRVAAFSLNHVALSLAVFTLADMLSGFAHVLMLLFGNLFIIVLEGMIVAIQTLRLEYYEGFSRYFYADGQPFKPLRLRKRKTSFSSNSDKEVLS